MIILQNILSKKVYKESTLYSIKIKIYKLSRITFFKRNLQKIIPINLDEKRREKAIYLEEVIL